MKGKTLIAVGLALAVLATQARAQTAPDAQTLADMKQELAVLYVEIQRLGSELNTTGGASGVSAGGTLEDRVQALEEEVTRLTGKSEELENRINQVVKDGTNRVGDLQFRLCDIDPKCDVSSLPETPTLGGGELPAAPSAPVPAAGTDNGTGNGNGSGEELAVSEQSDFNAAKSAFDGANWAEAAQRFGDFVETYPGSPLGAEADYLRGEALAKQGQVSDSARAYLDSFSAAPEGKRAPEALTKLGAALGQLGQVNEACVTLAEVGRRFPDSTAVAQADKARAALNCP